MILVDEAVLSRLIEESIKEAFLPESKSKILKEEPKLMTTAEVAKYLRVDRTTLWRWSKRGYLKPIEVGGLCRYRRFDVEKILNGL